MNWGKSNLAYKSRFKIFEAKMVNLTTYFTTLCMHDQTNNPKMYLNSLTFLAQDIIETFKIQIMIYIS